MPLWSKDLGTTLLKGQTYILSLITISIPDNLFRKHYLEYRKKIKSLRRLSRGENSIKQAIMMLVLMEYFVVFE